MTPPIGDRIEPEPVRLLHVELEMDGPVRAVGRIAWREGRIYFEYDPSFPGLSLPISPFHLPFSPGVIEGRREPFQGLHGLFNDSVPDGWARLLLDRRLSQIGVLPSSLTPLDRLACVGSRGMGALRYRPEYPAPRDHKRRRIDLDRIADEAQKVLAGDATQVLESLLDLGGSSGGARPKVLIGCDRSKKKLVHGVDDLSAGYRHWLLKFRSTTDAIDVGAVEYAYSQMASAAGVDMTETFLFPSHKGPGYFGTERFDRADNIRIHAHTLGGLLYADHRLPTVGYQTLLKTTRALTRSQVEVERVFRRMVFNVFAHNRDDHTKNHSFLMSKDGSWRASPAYDITFSSGPGGEHAMDIGGEGRAPTEDNIAVVAKEVGVSAVFAKQCIEEVRDAVHQWPGFAADSGVSTAQTKLIDKRLNGIRKRGRSAGHSRS